MLLKLSLGEIGEKWKVMFPVPVLLSCCTSPAKIEGTRWTSHIFILRSSTKLFKRACSWSKLHSRYSPISSNQLAVAVEQPITLRWSVVKATLGISSTMEDNSAVIVLSYTISFFRLKYRPPSVFDTKINSTHLQECLKQLLVLYESASGVDRTEISSAGESTPNFQVRLFHLFNNRIICCSKFGANKSVYMFW